MIELEPRHMNAGIAEFGSRCDAAGSFESARSLALARRSGCGERSAAVVPLAKTRGGGAIGVVYKTVGRDVDTLNENSSVEAGKHLHYTSRNKYYARCFAARSWGLTRTEVFNGLNAVPRNDPFS